MKTKLPLCLISFLLVIVITLAAKQAQAQTPTFTVLHSFSGVDGKIPQSNLLLDSAGNL